MRLLEHFGNLLQDVVLAGPDRGYLTALLFPAVQACKNLCPDVAGDARAAEILARPEIRNTFQERLDTFAVFNRNNSTCVVRAMLLDTLPSMEAREMTDKGSINQGAVLKNRAELVVEIYKEPVPANVLIIREEKA